MTRKVLQERHAEALTKAKAISENLADENGNLSAQDQERFDSLMAEVGDCKAKIAAIDEETRKAEKALNAAMGGGSVTFKADDGSTVRGYKHGEPMARAGLPAGVVQFGGGQGIDFGHGSQSNEVPSIGAVVHHAITGSDKFIDGKMAASLVPGGSGSHGYLLREELATQVYDLARAKSVVSRAGAVTVPLNEGRTLTLAGVASDPTSYWRHETVPVPATQATFNSKTIRLKTLAVLIPLSVELVEDAPNIVQIIESVIAQSLALKMDQAALAGEGNDQPVGILNEEGTNEESGVGTPDNYADVSSAIESIQAANYPEEDASGLAWIANPRDFKTYDGLVDTTGQPLQPTPWASQLRRMSTTSLEATAGSTSMVIGDFSQVILGVKPSGMRFEIFREGVASDENGDEYNAISQMLVWLRAYIRMDTAIIKPQFFTKLTGVTNS